MKKIILIVFLSFSGLLMAQNQTDTTKQPKQPKLDALTLAQSRVYLRAGNKQYIKKNYSEAQALYQKSLDKNKTYDKASFNMGNALYMQKNYKDALPQFELDAKLAKTKPTKAEAYHNIGNLQMKQKQYSKAVQAYEESLRNNPKDEHTRYNLALAQKLLKKQLNKKNQNKNKKNDKDKDKNKKGGGKDKNKNDKNKDKDKDKGGKDKDKKNKGGNDKNKDQQKQPQKGQMSPEKMKQLLEAMNNEEKKTQKKMSAKRVKGKKTKLAKDW